MNDEKYSDEIFESLLSVAVKKQIENDTSSFPTDEELEMLVEPSSELDRRVKRTVNKFYLRNKLKRISEVALKTVAMVCIVLTATTLVLMNVEASRVFILNAFLEVNEKFAKISYGENSGVSSGDEWQTPTYLPEGFNIVESFQSGSTYWIIIKDENDVEISIGQTKNGLNSTFSVDTENYTMIKATFFGSDAYIMEPTEANEPYIVSFQKDELVYHVYSYVTYDEIIKIIESIK